MQQQGLTIQGNVTKQHHIPASRVAELFTLNRFDKTGDISHTQGVSIQRRLTVGSPDDPLEHEADAMADKVMRMPEPSFIQRKCAHCDEHDKAQRKSLASSIWKSSD